MTHDVRILTRAEVERERADTQALGCNNTEHIFSDDKARMLTTIERMAGLLERWEAAAAVGLADHRVFLRKETQALLAAYRGDGERNGMTVSPHGLYVLHDDHLAELAKLRECVREYHRDCLRCNNPFNPPTYYCDTCTKALALVGGKEEVGNGK